MGRIDSQESAGESVGLGRYPGSRETAKSLSESLRVIAGHFVPIGKAAGSGAYAATPCDASTKRYRARENKWPSL